MPDKSLTAFRAAAARAGLGRIWIVGRDAVESAFASAHEDGGTTAPLVPPRTFHPGYRRAVLLASPGGTFWERFREAVPDPDGAPSHPLDHYTEQVVEALTGSLRQWDPSAVAVYPFRHARQVLNFQRMLGGTPWTDTAPFGMTIDPDYGPWFVWRAAVLTALDWPPTPLPEGSPCVECPAPCVNVCPAGAVAKSGFDWEACAGFRLDDARCRETCLARLACPVGAEHRYGREQMRYHYRASLRMIERWAARNAAG